MSDPNLNHRAARIAVEECVRRGCRTIVVCPGSRSAPLAAAAAVWQGRMPAGSGAAVDVRVAHDERGAAFLALGAARVTGRAAVVITTSGTAVANLLPAAVEASMDGIPMLLFTADRPPELHGCGANQSVPQAGMLAPAVRSAIDVSCPDDPGASPLDALDAVARAWQCAHGAHAIRAVAGPVHVNWRFREPLAPVAVPWSLPPSVELRIAQWQASGSEWIPDRTGRAGTPDPAVDALLQRLAGARRGIVVAGGARSPEDAEGLAQLARALRWPVVADITSGLRSGAPLPNVVHHADLALCAGSAGGVQPHATERVPDALRPDMILRVGGKIASKRVQQWMDDAVSGGCALAVAGDGIEPMDPSRRASVRAQVGARALAKRLSEAGEALPASEIAGAWSRADGSVAQALAESEAAADRAGAARIIEPMVARAALREAHGAGAIAMLSSSMPVRDAEMHADRAATPWCIANRGASGIDGIVATAAGACRASRAPVLLLVGDVAALHDLSSWSLLRDLPAPMCVVVVNNDGGGIFRFLPIAEHAAIYSPWFDSPHGLTFEGAAAMFSLAYERVGASCDVAGAVRRALRGDSPCPSPRVSHRARIVEASAICDRIIPDHREIQSACARAVRDALGMRPALGSRG